MNNVHYDATQVSKDEFIRVMSDAHDACRRWWFDKLDCSESVCRQRVEGISFEDAVSYFQQDDAIPVAVERRGDFLDEPYSEIGFHTMSSPSFLLWIIIDAGFVENLGFPRR